MGIIKERKMTIDSILPLVIEYREKADWTCHRYSNSHATNPRPCTDRAVKDFFSEIETGREIARLVISDIQWEKYSNCEGDDLYPVILNAVHLPDGRYFFELTGHFDTREFVFGY